MRSCEWALMMGLARVYKGKRKIMSLSCEDTVRRQLSARHEEALTRNPINHHSDFCWMSQPPKLWEINVCLLFKPPSLRHFVIQPRQINTSSFKWQTPWSGNRNTKMNKVHSLPCAKISTTECHVTTSPQEFVITISVPLYLWKPISVVTLS